MSEEERNVMTEEIAARKELYTLGVSLIEKAQHQGSTFYYEISRSSMRPRGGVLLTDNYRIQVCLWTWEHLAKIIIPTTVTYRIRPRIDTKSVSMKALIGGKLLIPVKTFFTSSAIDVHTPTVDVSFAEELDLRVGKKEMIPGLVSGKVNEAMLNQLSSIQEQEV